MKRLRRLKKAALARPVEPPPRASYYDPKTGVMTLHPPGEAMTFKESMDHTMQRLGGKEGMAHWAAYNPGHFYTLMARTLPLELAGKNGGPIEVTYVDPTQPLPEPKEINPAPKKTALRKDQH